MRVTTAGEELAVVGDQHDPGAEPAHERLQALEPGEVEVVGGLVEQHDVEAAEQQRGQRGAGGLPTGERRHQRVRADVEAEVGEHRRQPLVEVRGAAGQPVVEARGVRRPPRRVGTARSAELGGGRLHRLGRGGGTGTAGDVLAHGLAGDALVLLRQPADEGVAGRGRDGARRAGPGHRRGSAAGWSCRRRWRRPRRPRRRARRSGRGTRRGCGARGRRPGPWPRVSRSPTDRRFLTDARGHRCLGVTCPDPETTITVLSPARPTACSNASADRSSGKRSLTRSSRSMPVVASSMACG